MYDIRSIVDICHMEEFKRNVIIFFTFTFELETSLSKVPTFLLYV